jgi:hypothetical protein
VYAFRSQKGKKKKKYVSTWSEYAAEYTFLKSNYLVSPYIEKKKSHQTSH